MTQIAPEVRLHVDAYRDWLAEQHLPVLAGHFVADLNTVQLEPWALTGGRAAFIYLEGSEGTSGSYVCEIAPGESLKPQRHMFEEIIYILQGRGASTVWGSSGKQHHFEWQAGSLFAIPLNARYQLHNTAGSGPVRFVAVTTAPLLMNYFHNQKFIFDNPFSFEDRFGDEDDYFSHEGRTIDTRQIQVNFVPDVRNLGAAGLGRARRRRDEHELPVVRQHVRLAHFGDRSRQLQEGPPTRRRGAHPDPVGQRLQPDVARRG